MLTLALTDFQTELRFSNKIENGQIQPFVSDAYTLDVLPLLGYATLEKLTRLRAFTVAEFVPTADVDAGALVSRAERIYRAAGANPTEEPPLPGQTSPQWAYEPLLTLWHHYLKPWWLRQAYARFIAQHGIDVTKAGLTVPLDRSQGTYEKPSAADKASLQASVDTTAEAYRSRLTRFLRTENLLHQADCGCGYGYDAALLDTYAPFSPLERALLPLSTRHSSDRRHARRVRAV